MTPNYFFTSDTHFGHANIIKYCNRPFQNVAEMNETLIARWNEVVKPGDYVYHLGDFCFGDFGRYFNRLNGIISFIEGNHDRQARANKNAFHSYHKLLETRVFGQEIVLCHYSMEVWNKSHHGAWHLYGHSHGTLKDNPNRLSFDAGVDCHNFYPLSFEQVKAIMDKKSFKPIDHHGDNKTL